MKRYSFLIAFSIAMVMVLASASLAVFPKPDGYTVVPIKQGWYMDNLAWYFCSATNNIRWAQTQNLTLAPKLSSFAPPPFPRESRAMIFVTNPDQTQGPIFSQRPGGVDYSAIWQVVFVTWLPGTVKHVITNNQPAGPGNPNGIPLADVIIDETNIIVDCPIVALGRLGGPWLPKPDPPFYRIKQGILHDPYLKTITLPFWNVFCDDPITKAVLVRRMLITDAVDPAVVAELGTNLAPRLAIAAPATNPDTQRFWPIVWPGIVAQPPGQLPVIEDCPSSCDWRNTNFGYSPVMRYLRLVRDFTPPDDIPPWTIVNNDTFLLALLAAGRLDLQADRNRINAHVLCY